MASNEYYRYINSPDWYKKSAFFRKLTNGRCGVLPWLRCTDAHHLTYDNLGREHYIKDCIPVSRFVHDFIHKNPAGKYFWDDRKGKRRIMNHAFRITTLAVTVGAVAYTFSIAPLLAGYRLLMPKKTARPKLKRIKGRSHVK